MSKKEDDNRISKDALFEKVQEFCCSDSFEKEFEAFARKHSDVFMKSLDMDFRTEEHPMEFHEVYREYLRKFEGLIEDFITTTGYSVSEFYQECRDELEKGEVFGSKRFFIETMLATSEYENFFLLMRSEMRENQERSSRK